MRAEGCGNGASHRKDVSSKLPNCAGTVAVSLEESVPRGIT